MEKSERVKKIAVGVIETAEPLPVSGYVYASPESLERLWACGSKREVIAVEDDALFGIFRALGAAGVTDESWDVATKPISFCYPRTAESGEAEARGVFEVRRDVELVIYATGPAVGLVAVLGVAMRLFKAVTVMQPVLGCDERGADGGDASRWYPQIVYNCLTLQEEEEKKGRKGKGEEVHV